MNLNGALYVPGAETIKPALARLTQYALAKNIRIFGSVDRHFGTGEWKAYEQELQKWNGPFPLHCMDKTFGQKKIAEAVLGAFQIENSSPSGTPKQYAQVELEAIIADNKSLLFEKQGYSVFPTTDCPGGNRYAEDFLGVAAVTEAIVYGVATDYCVKAAVIGMQERGIQCYVVEDAIKGVAEETTADALKEMEKKGAKFVTTEQVLDDRLK
jgi:nicotinamidase/pyrazinamidase